MFSRPLRFVTIQGYSDRVTHALAFAAKHHDAEARKGTRAPYFIQPASVALILSRYGCADHAVVAAILYRVVDDWVRAGFTPAMLAERIGAKFGTDVLTILLEIARRRARDDGQPLTPEEQYQDFLDRLGAASTDAHWVCAADRLHECAALLADLRRTQFPDVVWSRVPGGADGVVARHRPVVAVFAAAGFTAPIIAELTGVLDAIAEFSS